MEKVAVLFCVFALIIALTATGNVEAVNCYVCSRISIERGYTDPVDCRDTRDAEMRQCGTGSSGCYTFRGSQQIGSRVIQDGILRLCNDQATREFLGQQSSWFWPVNSQQQQQSTCSAISINKASSVSGNTRLNGQLCSCSGDFCNTDTPAIGSSGISATGLSSSYSSGSYYSGASSVSSLKGIWLSAGLLIPVVLFRR